MPISFADGTVYKDEFNYVAGIPEEQKPQNDLSSPITEDYTGGRGPAKVTVSSTTPEVPLPTPDPRIRTEPAISENWKSLILNSEGDLVEAKSSGKEMEEYLKTFKESASNQVKPSSKEDAQARFQRFFNVFEAIEGKKAITNEEMLQAILGFAEVPHAINQLKGFFGLPTATPGTTPVRPQFTKDPYEFSSQSRLQNAPVEPTEPRTEELDVRGMVREGAKWIQDKTGIGKESYVKDFLTKFSNSKQLLDQYFEGKIEHNDPNLVHAVTTLASTAGGVGIASAPLRANSVGTFGGALGGYQKSYNQFIDAVTKEGLDTTFEFDYVKGKGFIQKFKDPLVQETFQDFEADFGKGTIDRLVRAGLPDEEITRLTGWFKDSKDGQWKFEIPDKDAVMDFEQLAYLKEHAENPGNSLKAGMIRLDDLLTHQQLWDIYPELRGYNVFYSPGGVKGVGTAIAAFSENSKTITLGPAFMKMPKEEQVSTLLHEIQHGIQGMEGFGRGGNKYDTPSGRAAQELDEYLTKGSDRVREISAKGSKASEQELLEASEFLEVSSEAYKKLEKLRAKAFQEYLNLPGEIESREVQRRYEAAIGYNPDANLGDVYFK